MAKKIDKSTVDAIRELLQQYDVKEDRIVIDLKNNMISEYEEAGISDLMSIRGPYRMSERKSG